MSKISFSWVIKVNVCIMDPVDLQHPAVYTNIIIANVTFRKNYLDLKIFYDDLVRYEVRHVPEYTTDTILGEIPLH